MNPALKDKYIEMAWVISKPPKQANFVRLQKLVSKNITCKIAKIFFGKSFSVIRCWHGRNELRIVSIAVDRRPHNMLSIHPCSKPVRDP